MEPDGMSASANKAGLPVASAEAVSGVHGSEDTPMVPVVLIEEDEANDPPEPPSSAAFNTTGTHNTSGEFKKKPGLRRSSNPTTGTGTGTNSGTPDTVRAAVAPAVAKHGLAARRPSSQQTTTRIPDPPDHEYDSHSTDFHEGLVPQPPAARPPMATPNSVMEVPRAPSGNVFTDTMIHYKTEAMNHEENDEENPPIVEENLLSPPTDPKSATDKTASLSVPLSEKQDSKKSISEDTVAVPKVWIWTCLVLIILVGGIGAAVGITLKVSNNDSESTPTTTTTTTATSSSSESLPATVGPIATTQLTDSGPTANDLDPLDTTTPAPTDEPVSSPAQEPTMSPTTEPTVLPTTLPTEEPTISPTISPTAEPTAVPTPVPTDEPVSSPTVAPTISVTDAPSAQPTSTNLDGLTPEQSTSAPTTLTTTTATATNPQTTVPTEPPNVSQPSTSPTGSESPSLPPSTAPTTQIPSANPSVTPTVGTNNPTTPPSTMPPTAKPTTPSPTTSTINIPSNPTGTSESSIPCSTNENCASGICINNQCAQDFLSDFELCQEDEDCEFDACRANGTSPGSSTTEETLGTKICCPNGMVSQDSRVCGGLPTGTYCRDIDTGFSYNSLYQSEANSICASGICVNDVCVESLQPHSSPCTENADCSSDICVEDVCLSGALADFAPCTENADCGVVPVGPMEHLLEGVQRWKPWV
ncbi:Cohesin domain [Seminavis robusta]|uniref:Cohesin domain n=1 Tax=Seminavis robusta TaxID=568900 RepID=A0A9N8H4E3_9STRA|nr:Cohesin domain [Seminavis robusta]|eukprot:Sro7_g006030.1 Cohesin domain (700) ;mRNA; f:124982-127081